MDRNDHFFLKKNRSLLVLCVFIMVSQMWFQQNQHKCFDFVTAEHGEEFNLYIRLLCSKLQLG